MKVRHRKGIANHPGVESCGGKGGAVHVAAALVMPQLLRDSFMTLKRDAAVGVNGVKWREYEERIDERIGELWGAV